MLPTFEKKKELLARAINALRKNKQIIVEIRGDIHEENYDGIKNGCLVCKDVYFDGVSYRGYERNYYIGPMFFDLEMKMPTFTKSRLIWELDWQEPAENLDDDQKIVIRLAWMLYHDWRETTYYDQGHRKNHKV